MEARGAQRVCAQTAAVLIIMAILGSRILDRQRVTRELLTPFVPGEGVDDFYGKRC